MIKTLNINCFYGHYVFNKYDIISIIMKNRLDQEFIKSLVVIAAGISRNSDPYELVNGVFEYLKKNWER